MHSLFAETLGKVTGSSKGMGGSMHVISKENGFHGSVPIVSATIPISIGAGLTAKIQKKNAVSVSYFGDGATEEGTFHESLNLASFYKLPVLFVCENNLYMEYTPIREVTSVENPAADRASAYNMEKIIVDGNDVDEMYKIAKKTINKARGGDGPSLIEAKTYRHYGHSRTDPAKYRPKDESQEWIHNKDPIKIYKQRLLESGIEEKKIKSIENNIISQIDDATETAKSSPFSSIDLIYKDLWFNGGSEWHN